MNIIFFLIPLFVFFLPANGESQLSEREQDCLPAQTNLQHVLSSGKNLNLCPKTTYLIGQTLTLTTEGQRVFTQGANYFKDHAIIKVIDSQVGAAINAMNVSHITIKDVTIDGNRTTLGNIYKTSPQNNTALVTMGGNSENQQITNCYIKNTRTWSSLQIYEGDLSKPAQACRNARVTKNIIESAGTDPRGNGKANQLDEDKRWADGISLACRDALVQENLILDATDGGIVVFGASGSEISYNTIVARSRDLLGGINLVDPFPFDCPANSECAGMADYRGTVVEHNAIIALGARVYIGIAMGSATWSFNEEMRKKFLYGATVRYNALKGNLFGYGFVANGIKGFNVYENYSEAVHMGEGDGIKYARPASSVNGAFQYDSKRASKRENNLQDEFKPAENLNNLLMIDFYGKTPFPYANQVSSVLTQSFLDILKRLPSSQELTLHGNDLLKNKTNSDSKRREFLHSQEFYVNFPKLIINSVHLEKQRTWEKIRDYLETQNEKEGLPRLTPAMIYFKTEQILTNQSLAVSITNETTSNYPCSVIQNSAVLHAGQCIVVDQPLKSLNGLYALRLQGDGNLVLYDRQQSVWSTKTNSKRSSYLVMQHDGNLVLYSHTGNVIWASNTYQPSLSSDYYLKLQDDRNLVIYKGSTAIWASKTNY